ncbi:MAG: hypothetical protein DMF38_08050 [Verrucomicrobia bacterium]|nr:MAG: hypothetical protein DMF38_08050 [Verrucomicrobiota bacterium]
MTLLRGIVRSGKGNFSFWLAKLESYYTQKTGMKLYPGTLTSPTQSFQRQTIAFGLKRKNMADESR